MKNTLVIISSYGSCSYWKMTGPLTAGQPSKNFIFGHAHWIPLIEKWGKSLGKNNFPQYLPFQDALILGQGILYRPQKGSTGVVGLVSFKVRVWLELGLSLGLINLN